MIKAPLVSVIIPVHNGANFLQETLNTVYQQDYSTIEIIAINHGSEDASQQILLSQSGIRVIQQGHLGNAHARNTGIQQANGDFIAFLDQDDLWDSAKVRKQVEALMNNSEALFSISHFVSFLSSGSTMPSWAREETFTKGKPDYSPSSLVARKEAFIRNGLFNEDLKIASDVDWFFLAQDRQLPMVIVPEILHKRRVHNNNQSQCGKPYNKEMLALIRGSVQRKKGGAEYVCNHS